jgi:hypothetical protein
MGRSNTTRVLVAFSVFACATFAEAGLSEINTHFLNQTGPFGSAAVFTIGSSSDGNYVLCTAFNSPAPPVTSTLAWTDENGNSQSWSGSNDCTTIRGRAGSAVYVSTSGSSGNYSLAVIGFGFWPGQPQKQGGIKEVLAGSISSGEYLFLVQPCAGTSTLTVPGFGAIQTGTHGLFLPVIAAGGVLSISSTCNTVPTVTGIGFGTPAVGSGPLKDYETNLVDWTDATYPDAETVFSQSRFVNMFVAANIAEVPNSGSVSEELGVGELQGVQFTGYGCGLTAPPSGAPSACAMLIQSTVDAVDYRTINGTAPVWGSSPAYNAEVAAIEY